MKSVCISGVYNLCRQLSVEENYYSAVSIIEALGKLRDAKAITYINNWIQNYENNIISEKQFFVLKHARIAISKLVDAPNAKELIHFDEKYQRYLRDYFIL